ncbi:MAG TPA: Lsa family ABC-F type ribosomal protection protein, partial [Ruminococcaceae bacterium]|nr:Lsa family ABC-F type ribosomal protection protein [Oscillospiraceae bacterium]
MSLISVVNLTFTYDGSYDNIFESVSFQLDTDWKLGFTGRNGRGKTTFLKLLLGKYEYSGSISSSCRFEYFPYDIKNPAQTTAEIENGICPDCLQWEITREFSLLELDEEVLCRPFASLSSGEQTKAMLAGMFLRENAFLLIDEPTNHLDLRGREIVSRYLKSKKGFILVSHDRAFLDGCVDHILSINKTNIDIQRGNFSSWLLDKERRDSSQLSENEKLQKEISQLSAAAKRTSAWSDKAEKAKYDTKNSGLRADRGYVGHKAAKMMKRSKAIETRRKAAADEKAHLLDNLESSEALKLTRLPYHTNRLVVLDGVTIRYGEKTACRDVSFCIDQGDRAALCGKNGSGKSSILKLICGEALDYSGNFQKGSRLLVSYVPQNTSNLS